MPEEMPASSGIPLDKMLQAAADRPSSIAALSAQGKSIGRIDGAERNAGCGLHGSEREPIIAGVPICCKRPYGIGTGDLVRMDASSKRQAFDFSRKLLDPLARQRSGAEPIGFEQRKKMQGFARSAVHADAPPNMNFEDALRQPQDLETSACSSKERRESDDQAFSELRSVNRLQLRASSAARRD